MDKLICSYCGKEFIKNTLGTQCISFFNTGHIEHLQSPKFCCDVCKVKYHIRDKYKINPEETDFRGWKYNYYENKAYSPDDAKDYKEKREKQKIKKWRLKEKIEELERDLDNLDIPTKLTKLKKLLKDSL